MNYYLLLLFSINFCHHWRETLTGDSAGHELSGRPYIEWCEEAGFRKRLYASNCQAFSFVYPYPSCYCVDGIAILTIEPDRENIREIQFSKKGCFNHKIFGFNNRTITIQPHQFSEVDTIVGIQLQREHVDPGSSEDYYEDLGIQIEWKFFTLSNVTQAQKEPVTTLSSVVIYNGELIDVNQDYNNGTLLCIQKNSNPDLAKQVRHYKLQANTWMWLNATCDGGNYVDDLEILSAGSLGTIDNRRCIPRCPEYDEASSALTLAKANDPRNSRMKLKPLIGETEDTYCSPIPTKLQLLHQDLNDRILRHAIERAFYDSQNYKPDYKPAYTFKVLQLLAKVTTKFCTHANVPPTFLEKAIEYFKIAHEGRGFYFVEAYSFLNFNSISKLLRRCLSEMDSVPYFTSQGCLRSEILSVYNSPMNKSAAKIVPLSFAHKNFDYHVVLDVPWNMLDLANTVCLRAFRKSYRMYHELERGMEKLYTPELRLFWRYPNVPEYFYEHIFGPHWMTYARNLEKCVESAYMKQPKMSRLIRPQWISGQPHASYQNRGTTLVDPICRRRRIDLPIISNNFDIYCHPQSQHNLKTTTLATKGPKVTHHSSSTANYMFTNFPVGGVQSTTERRNDNNGDTYIDFPPKTYHVTTPKIPITGDVYIDFQPIITDQKPTKKGDQTNTNKQANISSNKDINLQKPGTHPQTTRDVYTEVQNTGDVYIDFHPIRDQSILNQNPNKNSDIRIDFKPEKAQSPKNKGPNKSNTNLLQSPGTYSSISEIANGDVLIDFPSMTSGLVAGQKSNINSHVQIQHTTYRPLSTISKASITSNKDNNLQNLGTNLPTDKVPKTSDVFIDFQEKSLHLPIDPYNEGGAKVDVHNQSGQHQTTKIPHAGDVYIGFQPIRDQSTNQPGQKPESNLQISELPNTAVFIDFPPGKYLKPNMNSNAQIDLQTKEAEQSINEASIATDWNRNMQTASLNPISKVPISGDVLIDFPAESSHFKTDQVRNTGGTNTNLQKPNTQRFDQIANTGDVYIGFQPTGDHSTANQIPNDRNNDTLNRTETKVKNMPNLNNKNINMQNPGNKLLSIEVPINGDVLTDFPAENSYSIFNNSNSSIRKMSNTDAFIDFQPMQNKTVTNQNLKKLNNFKPNDTQPIINNGPNAIIKDVNLQKQVSKPPKSGVRNMGDVYIDFQPIPDQNQNKISDVQNNFKPRPNTGEKSSNLQIAGSHPQTTKISNTGDVFIDFRPITEPSATDSKTNKITRVQIDYKTNPTERTKNQETYTSHSKIHLQQRVTSGPIKEVPNSADVLIDFPTQNSHVAIHQVSNTSGANNNYTKPNTQPSKGETISIKDVYIDFPPKGGPTIKDQITNKPSNVRNPITPKDSQLTSSKRPNTTNTNDKNANLQINSSIPTIVKNTNTGDVLLDFPTQNSHLTLHQATNTSVTDNNFTKPYTQPSKVETPNTKDVYIDFQPIKGPSIQGQTPTKPSNPITPAIHLESDTSGVNNNFTKPNIQPQKVETLNTRDVYIDFQPIEGPSIQGQTPNKTSNVLNPISQKESHTTLNKRPNTTNTNDKLQIPGSNPSIGEKSDTGDVLIDFPLTNSNLTMPLASKTSGTSNNFTKPNSQLPKAKTPYTGDVYINFQTITDHSIPIQKMNSNPPISDVSNTDDVLIDLPAENYHLMKDQIGNKSGAITNFQNLSTQKLTGETPQISDVYLDIPRLIVYPLLEKSNDVKDNRKDFTPEGAQSAINKGSKDKKINLQTSSSSNNPPISKISNTDVYIDFKPVADHLLSPKSKVNSHIQIEHTTKRPGSTIHNVPITSYKNMVSQKPSKNSSNSGFPTNGDVLTDFPATNVHSMIEKAPDTSGANTFQKPSTQQPSDQIPNTVDVYIDFQPNQNPSITHQIPKENSNNHNFTKKGDQSNTNKQANNPSNNLHKPDTNPKIGQISTTGDVYIDFFNKTPQLATDQPNKGGANVNVHKTSNQPKNGEVPNTGDVYIDFQPLINSHVQIQHTTYRPLSTISKPSITSNKDNNLQNLGTNLPTDKVTKTEDVFIDFPVKGLHVKTDPPNKDSANVNVHKPSGQQQKGEIPHSGDVYIGFPSIRDQSTNQPGQSPNKISDINIDFRPYKDQSPANKGHNKSDTNLNLQSPASYQSINEIANTDVLIDFPPITAALVTGTKSEINSHVQIKHTTEATPPINKVPITSDKKINFPKLGSSTPPSKILNTDVFIDFQPIREHLKLDKNPTESSQVYNDVSYVTSKRAQSTVNKGVITSDKNINLHKPATHTPIGNIPKDKGDVYLDFQRVHSATDNNLNVNNHLKKNLTTKEKQPKIDNGAETSSGNTNFVKTGDDRSKPSNNIGDVYIDFKPVNHSKVQHAMFKNNSAHINLPTKVPQSAIDQGNNIANGNNNKFQTPATSGSNTNHQTPSIPLAIGALPSTNGVVLIDFPTNPAYLSAAERLNINPHVLPFQKKSTHVEDDHIVKTAVHGNMFTPSDREHSAISQGHKTNFHVITDFPIHDGSSKVAHEPDKGKYDENTDEKRGEVKIGFSNANGGNTVNSVKDGSTKRNENTKINPKPNAGSAGHSRTVHKDFQDNIAADYARHVNSPAVFGSKNAKGGAHFSESFKTGQHKNDNKNDRDMDSTDIDVDFSENRPARMSYFDSNAATYTTKLPKANKLSYLPTIDNIVNPNANLEQADIENVLANIPRPEITNRQQTVKTQNSNYYEYTHNGQESTKLKTDQVYMQQNSRQSENSLLEALMEDYQNYDYKLQFVTAPTHYDDSLSNLKEKNTLHAKPLLDFVSKNQILLPTSSRQSSRLSFTSKHDSSSKNTEPWGPQKSQSNFLSANHDIKRQIQTGKKVETPSKSVKNIPRIFDARNLQLQVEPSKQDNGDLPKTLISLPMPTTSEIDKWIKANIATPKFSSILKILRKPHFQCSNTQLLYPVKEDCTLFYTCLPGVLLSSADEQKQDTVLVMYKCNQAKIFDATLHGCTFGNCSPQLLQDKQKESQLLNSHV